MIGFERSRRGVLPALFVESTNGRTVATPWKGRRDRDTK